MDENYEEHFEDNEDDDDEGVIDLTPEQVQDIINWAVSTGTIITLMYHQPVAETEEEVKSRHENLDEGVRLIYNNMPDCITAPVHERAVEIIDEAEEEERIVAEFRDEIDKNLG